MSQAAKRHEMTSTSVALILLALCLAACAGLAISANDVQIGIVLIALALLIMSPIPLFIWPTECRVINKSGNPCKQTAYGFLFGCSYYYHWWPKFFARLGFHTEALRQVGYHQSAANKSTTVRESAAQPQAEPPRVRIDDSALSVCGTWAGIVSAATGVIGLIVAIH